MMLPSQLVERYHSDPESVYATWFLQEERLKAFRTIRSGIQLLVQDLASGTFANDYRGSTLETVVEAIAEQKQVFAGAAHPFYWKPKLRIPDIYESRPNQQRYASFLSVALRASDPDSIVREVLKLADPPIRGLGPASGNLLYFLHPRLFPPFNTAILRGYNWLTGQRLKLGDWQSYLHLRDGLLLLIRESGLSKDLGDGAGLCFEVGIGRMVDASLPEDARREIEKGWQKETAKRHKEIVRDVKLEQEHAEQQAMLANLGRSWGFRTWIARNDHSREWSGGTLGKLSLPVLPPMPEIADVNATVELIDVLWLDASRDEVVAAFEVEKSTSIYSGILRLYDLALCLPCCRDHLYLVAPDEREREVRSQLCRPSLAIDGCPRPAYVLFSELAENFSSLARFGDGLSTLKKLARQV
jgi:type II restriction enzyme